MTDPHAHGLWTLEGDTLTLHLPTGGDLEEHQAAERALHRLAFGRVSLTRAGCGSRAGVPYEVVYRLRERPPRVIHHAAALGSIPGLRAALDEHHRAEADAATRAAGEPRGPAGYSRAQLEGTPWPLPDDVWRDGESRTVTFTWSTPPVLNLQPWGDQAAYLGLEP